MQDLCNSRISVVDFLKGYCHCDIPAIYLYFFGSRFGPKNNSTDDKLILSVVVAAARQSSSIQQPRCITTAHKSRNINNKWCGD